MPRKLPDVKAADTDMNASYKQNAKIKLQTKQEICYNYGITIASAYGGSNYERREIFRKKSDIAF